MALIGNITVPEITPTGTYPLVPDFGYGVALDFEVVIHPFGSANSKIEQRFLVGTRARRFILRHSNIRRSSLDALKTFWETNEGAYGSFTYNAPNPDGTTTAYTCRFADQALSWEHFTNKVVNVGVELLGIPTSFPSYVVSSTELRFPGTSLKTALLAQVQELVPLIKIQPRESGYPAIYISDRQCQVDGELHHARLLSWRGISQTLSTIGPSDQANFVFGNADRVMRDLANDTDLWRCDIEFSIYHVGTGIKLNFWKGYATTFSGEESDEFSIAASDGMHQLTQMYPIREVSRTCWKKFDSAACPYSSVGVGGHTECDKSFAACVARGMEDYYGGINVRPQGVTTKDNSTGTWGFGRQLLSSFSLVNDSIYGLPLQEVYTDAEFLVNCMLAAGREEGDFYAALGIVGVGPISAYAADGLKHRLDGSAAHGPLPLGLRRSLGHDPVLDNDPDADSKQFSIDGGTFTGDKAAGVAFIQIRRADVKGLQLTRATEHSMQAVVSGGMGGWYWTDASTRAWAAPNTNPIWIAVNVRIRAAGLENATAAEQLELFDVDSAIACAAICSDVVNKIFGGGTETQFRYRGVIRDPAPLRDVIQNILNNCLGYTINSFGKLKFGIRINSSVVEAFTVGNIILDSLQLQSADPQFNDFTATYADEEYNYATNTVNLYDQGHKDLYGKIPGSINLNGTFTKSQASRIVITRHREELGGITAADMRNARRGAFKTTVLALNCEPGMVCSLTHDDMPGGAGEFRIQRLVLNPDWSVDIEWRTTVDSMYDMTVGPKPVDVTADALPVEQVIDLSPGDVQPIGADAFQVSQSDDGINVYFDIIYSPPGTDSNDIGTFSGIYAHIEAPDGSGILYPQGKHDYNGDPDGIGALRYGSAQLVLPLPIASADWRIIVASRSLVYIKKPVLTGAGATPSMVVTVPAQYLPGVTPPPQIVEATLSVAISEYRTDLDGQQWAKIVISYTPPGGTPSDAYPGAWIYEDASGAPDPAVTNALDGSPWYATSMGLDIVFWMKRENADLDYWARVTVNSSAITVVPDSSSPKVAFTIPKYADAPQVTGLAVTVISGVNGGVPSGKFKWRFTKPSDPEYWYVRISRIRTDASFTPLSGATYGIVAGPIDQDPADDAQVANDWWPKPPAAEYWIFKAESINQAGDANTTSAPTYNVTVPANPGIALDDADPTTIGTGLVVSGGVLRIPDLGITESLLAALSVSQAKVQDAAINTQKLANLAVDNTKIAALAVDAAKLASSAVTSTKIANLAVGTAAIANLAVGTAQIADAAIVNAKLGSLSVATANIQDAAILEAKIANLAVTNAKINDLSVAKLTAGSASFSGSVTFSASASMFIGGVSGVTISPGNLNATTINATSAAQGWTITPGIAPTIQPVSTSLSSIDTAQYKIGGTQIVDSSRNANFASLSIGGVSVIDSGRNGSMVNLYLSGQFRTSNYVSSGSPASPATHKVPVYDQFGSLLNYMFLYP